MSVMHTKRKAAIPYFLLLPSLLMILCLVLYPLIKSLIDVVHSDNLLEPWNHKFVGVKNFTSVLKDPQFLSAAINTAEYLLVVTLGAFLFGVLIALWLHKVNRVRGLFLAIIIFPWAIPGTVGGLLWGLIFNPSSGLLDSLLTWGGFIHNNIVWMGGVVRSLVSISVMALWQVLPITSIIIFAGIESIPSTIYEAANVDGAGAWRGLFKITFPLMRPALAIGMLNAGIMAIGLFDQIYVLNGFSPVTQSVTMQTYLYAFQNMNFGVAIASSLVITFGTLILSLLYLKFVYKEVVF